MSRHESRIYADQRHDWQDGSEADPGAGSGHRDILVWINIGIGIGMVGSVSRAF
jgi:hypothetical protein